MTPLDTDEMFGCLDRHGVRYVLIGGLAAVLHGSPLPTLDAHICPARDIGNLTRLASALDELDARIRTADTPNGVRFPRDAAFLRGVELLNLVTRAGDLDVAFVPAGGAAYEDFAPRALSGFRHRSSSECRAIVTALSFFKWVSLQSRSD